VSDLLKLLLVEDDPLFRLGLSTYLGQEPTIELVTEASNNETALKLVQNQAFDVVILDLGFGGIETCRQLQQYYPTLPVLILTSHPDKTLVIKLIALGIKGYCLKGIDAENLVLAIRSIAMGATWWDLNASNQIQMAIHQCQEPTILANEHQLTSRELEVLTLIAAGLSNQQIAGNLFITAGTVRVHIHAIFQKLNVTGRTQAAIVAMQRNLIS
jgi:two-component system, NarL family, response regulator